MAAIEVSDKENVDFKYNLKVYFRFLSKYKGLSFFLIFLAFIISSLDLVFNYIFKLLVDSSTQLNNHQITPGNLEKALIWPLAGLIAVPLLRAAGRGGRAVDRQRR